MHTRSHFTQLRIFVSIVIIWGLLSSFRPAGSPQVHAAAPLASGITGTITRPGFLPSALALDETRNRLFVFDKSTGNIYFYDATTLAELGSVATTFEESISMVIDESQGKLYAGYWGPGAGMSNNVAVIDTATGTLLKYVLASGFGQLVNDEALDAVYVSSNGSIIRIDAATDVETPIAGITGNMYTSMAVNPVTHELFVSNWSQNDGNLFVVNPTTLAVTAIPDMNGFGVAVNWTENKAYVTYCAPAGMEAVCIYDRDTGTITSFYISNDSSQPLVFNPLVNRMYSDTEVNAVTTILNGSTDEFVNVSMTGGLGTVAVRNSTDHVYFVRQDGTYVMDGSTHEIIADFPAEYGIGCSICSSHLLVNQTSGLVYVINDTTNGEVVVIQDGEFSLPACTVTPVTLPDSFPGAVNSFDCRSPIRKGTTYWDPFFADRYSIEVEAGEQIQITLDSDDAYEYLYLVDPSGNVIAEDAGGYFDSAKIPSSGWFTFPSSGTYILEATTEYDGVLNMSYMLTLVSTDTFPLSVVTSGTGSGTVTSSPPGIDCGSDCAEDYFYNTSVTLLAEPGVGSSFTGWSGACSGTSSCEVSMTSARSVTATFSAGASYTISGNAGVGGATLTPSGADPVTANAGGDYSLTVPSGWSGTVTPSLAGYTFSPASQVYTNVSEDRTAQDYTATATGAVNLLQDPSFEPPVSAWTETYTTGSVLCPSASCDPGGARTGLGWAWFGGWEEALDESTLSQTVTIPSGTATLQFYLAVFDDEVVPGDANDRFTVMMDGDIIFTANATEDQYWGYTLVNVNVSNYANGAVHTLVFSSTITDQYISFYLDDVSLLSETAGPEYTISGNAGVAGTILSYPGGSATASSTGDYSFTVPEGWSGTVTPAKAGYTFDPDSITYTNVTEDQVGQDYTVGTPSGNLIEDPGFELFTPNPFWTESSTNYATPLCTIDFCELAGSHTGLAWAWFGGTTQDEEGSLSQPVTIPPGVTTLEFYFWIESVDQGSDANDRFTATLDDTTVFSTNATEGGLYPAYTLVSVDVSAHADGAVHTLAFTSVTTGQFVNFFLDDVSLEAPLTISGNAGVGGATLTYTGGEPVTAGPTGAYSLPVPEGWTGTVTPSKTGYTFEPPDRTYSTPATEHQTGQDYTATALLGSIVRVKTVGASTPGCGTDWDNPCDLQYALANTAAGSEIWVAAGTYTPDGDSGDRTATFQLRSGVAIYGGFAGSESARSERAPLTNVTTLSGDLNGDDGPDFANDSENSYHVITAGGADNTAILDGFTIRGGNADGTNPHFSGGGMYNPGGSPTLTDVVFTANRATSRGGAIYNTGSPALTNVGFDGNSASYGGAIYSTGTLSLTDVTFNNNLAFDGGGLHNYGGSPVLTNVVFNSNHAGTSGYGGGMYTDGGSPVLSDVTFSGNSASAGGGLFVQGGSPTLTDIDFFDNDALDGAGMHNSGLSTISSVTFRSNTATRNGGGLFNNTYSTFTNVTFFDNEATQYAGGGMSSSGSPILTNVTFSGNRANYGGALLNSDNTVLRNVIVWGNTATTAGPQMYNDPGVAPDISNSVVQDGCPEGGVCTNIITADPLLGPLGAYGGDTQTIPLQPGSSAIDAGDDSNCPAADQRGVTRPQGNGCDIGAYESKVWVVMSTADSGPGTLRQAILDAADGDTIRFAPSLAGQTIGLTSTLVLNKDLNIDGSGLSPQVTISGQDLGHLEVPYGATVLISDMTISDADFGILLRGGLTIRNSTLKNNFNDSGGAISNFGGSLTIENSTITQNYAVYDGGAIFIDYGYTRIVNSTITQNQAGQQGGALYVQMNAMVEIINSTIAGNSAAGYSELRIMSDLADVTVINSIFVCTAENDNCYLYPAGTLGQTHSIFGVGTLADFGLSPLADNGGPTQTMALLPGSPAINAGDDTYCPDHDQRGVTRPVEGQCDIGAYESEGYPAVINSLRTDPTVAASVHFTVTFSEPVTSVDKDDFVLAATGVTGAMITGVSGSDTVYIVTVNTGVAGSSDGTLRLDVVDDDSIRDAFDNPLGGLGEGNGNYNLGESYTIPGRAANLTAPMLISLRRNQIISVSTPEFSWRSVTNAARYEIVFATNSTFTQNVDPHFADEASFVSNALADGKYYWRVRAYNDLGQPGPWSASRYFTVDTVGPPPPASTSPADGTALRGVPSFRWRAVSGAVLYEFEIDNEDTFSSPLYSLQQRLTSRRLPGGLRGTYYWRVRARDAAGNWGPWSPVSSVTILPPR